MDIKQLQELTEKLQALATAAAGNAESETKLTLRQAIDTYQAEHVSRLAESTQDALNSYLRRMADMLPMDATPKTLTKHMVECALNGLRHVRTGARIGPRTWNKFRRYGIDALTHAGWPGSNPFKEVKPRTIKRAKKDAMTLEEAARLLRCTPDAIRRRLYAAAIYTVSRAGELFAWTRRDIQLERALFAMLRSNKEPTTKNGTYREDLHLHSEFIPYLVEQLASHTSAFVFPAKDGRQRRATRGELAKRLRTDLKRAGILLGYQHVCRRKGCGFAMESQEAAAGRCPRCDFKLWAKAIPKRITFHGLRRCGLTLYKKAGTDQLARKRLAGHAISDITDREYTAEDLDWEAAELEKLSLGGRRGGCNP